MGSTLIATIFATPTPTPSPRPANLKLSRPPPSIARPGKLKRTSNEGNAPDSPPKKQNKKKSPTVKPQEKPSLRKRKARKPSPSAEGELTVKQGYDYSHIVRAEDFDRIPHYAGLRGGKRHWFSQYRPFEDAVGEALFKQEPREDQNRELHKTVDYVDLDFGRHDFRHSDLDRAEDGIDGAASEGEGKPANHGEPATEVLVTCSFFVCVLLNIEARYGIEVQDLIRDVLKKVSNHKEHSDGRSHSLDALTALKSHHRSNMPQSAEAQSPPVPDSSSDQKNSPSQSTKAQTDVPLVLSPGSSSWENVCQQLLGWQGKQDLRVNPEGQWSQQLSDRLKACEHVAAVGRKILGVELEAEAERRTKQSVVFCGVDKGHDVLHSRREETHGEHGPEADASGLQKELGLKEPFGEMSTLSIGVSSPVDWASEL
ncbi:hypothetical protein K461DRAFT_292981 [Myriangium duriaei CBS 260.36]|uniref:Uncharacterized protein n=1 Tax=Myriangium duriaei CBS 260.36 TaxID=1168546 RepID=A0A9P4J6F3_9PEZI|nr:hypothetical protein K461DRAFT_292981 [Myriangium duriaei CBS 260.36]